MTNAITIRPRPRRAASTMARGRKGMTRNQSVRRMRITSAQPPKYPAVIPTKAPISIDIAVARNPTSSEI
jgi:hypothetical protein